MSDRSAQHVRGWRRLIACVAVIAGVWLIVLPWIGRRDSVAKRIEWLDQRGIDPSAMYYTELEAMRSILDGINRRHRRRDLVDVTHQVIAEDDHHQRQQR